MTGADSLPCCPGGICLLRVGSIAVVISHQCAFDVVEEERNKQWCVTDEVASKVRVSAGGALEKDVPHILRVDAVTVLAA